MTRDEFVNEVAERIENAIMRAQGIGDGCIEDETPNEIAKDIASLLPDYAFHENE
jgi:hypothetical protein